MSKKPRRLSWGCLVEQRILAAQEEGRFDNLPDFGRPCAAIDEPYEELWWVKRFLKREGLATLPVSLKIRRVVEREMQRIMSLGTQAQVREAVVHLNEKIHAANLRAVRGPPSVTCLLDVNAVVARWQQQEQGEQRKTRRRN